MELEPGDAQARANLARCVSCTGDFKGGLREAREAVRRAPHLSGARGVLLEALENNDLLEEFREEAERQAKEYPEDFYPWEARARVALMDNDAPKAKKCFLKAVDIKPDSNLAWSHLGALYLAEGNCLEAFKAFGRAQASAKDSPFPLQVSRFSALIGMAYSQLFMDNAEWALILAEQAEGLNVNVAEARRFQARCKLSLSSVDAVSTVESAIKLGGRDGYLEMALALHKVESGDKIGARNTIETVDPGSDPYARNLRALTLGRLGRLQDAIAQLEDLVGELPEYVRQNSTSIAYLYNNQPHEALSAIKEALKHRRDEATLTNAGILCAGNVQPEEAEGFFKEALKVRPDSPSALLNLGRLYIEKGKYSLARTTLKRVANSDKYNPRLKSAGMDLAS